MQSIPRKLKRSRRSGRDSHRPARARRSSSGHPRPLWGHGSGVTSRVPMGETPMAKSVDNDNGLSPGPHVERPTLAELARAAGVNKSTASRALRGNRAIGTETRERIQQLAAELNYE